MKFVADCMLGKLAKWLRLIGCDTEYIHDAEDSDLIRIAIQQDRILLTRDCELANRKILNGRALLIEDDRTSQQLIMVMQAFGLRINMFTRCAVCNGEIVKADKNSVREFVPPYVFSTQDSFGRCLVCGRIYWRGTHIDNVIKQLEAILPQST